MKSNARTSQISAAQAARILERDLGRCVVCGAEVAGGRRARWDIHLRVPRPATGQGDDPRVLCDSNLVAVCGVASSGTKCAGALGQYPIAARARGLVLWRSQSPWLVPVQVWTAATKGHLLEEYTTPYVLDDGGGRSALTRLDELRAAINLEAAA
ncbi:hypothetical protein GCM10027447_12730 [Glycomyces halotolerans]